MKKHIILLLAGCSLAFGGCCTSRNAGNWEYKTVLINRTGMVSLEPDKSNMDTSGWYHKDEVINTMVKEGWIVAGFGVGEGQGQWFLLKRHRN